MPRRLSRKFAMTARDELEEYGFSPRAAEMLSERIHEPFPDYVVLAEDVLGKGGALTREQLVYIEWLYRSHNIGREREVWEGLKRAPERERLAKKRPSVRREVVRIFGKRTVVYRDLHTGRWTRKPRRMRA